MNICIMLQLHTHKRGGTEAYLERLGRLCRARGLTLHVAVLSVSQDVHDWWLEAGAHVHQIGHFTPLRLMRLLRDIDPRAIALHFFPMNSMVPWWVRTHSQAHILVVDDHSGWPQSRSPLKRWLSQQRHRFALAPASRIIAVSHFVARRLRVGSGVDEDRIRVNYNGVRAPTHRAALPTTPDTCVIAAAGFMIPEKGFDVLLRALCALRDVIEADFELVLAGEGPCQQELRDFVHEHQLPVHFLGLRQDIPEVFAAADIAVVPSLWHEAFGFVAAEAMRAGVAVIASDIGGLPELLEHEHTGVLVPPGDVEALVESLTRLVQDPEYARQLGSAALYVAQQHLTLERMTQTMLRFFLEVLHEPRTHPRLVAP